MVVYLIRYASDERCTRGVLIAGDVMLRTLELPWRDNKANVSCIPTGEYDVDYLPRSASGKFRQVYHVRNVPNRSGILFHNGNVPSQIQGCILVGMKSGELSGQPAVLSSSAGMEKMRQAVGRNSFKLKVIDYGHNS